MPFKPTHFSFYGHQNNSPNSCVPGVRHNVKNYAGSPASLCTFWARFCMFFWTKMHIPTQVFYKNAHFGTLFFAKIMKKILFLGGVCSTFQSYPIPKLGPELCFFPNSTTASDGLPLLDSEH